MGAGAGITGIAFNYVLRRHDAHVELYIDTPDAGENQRMFAALFVKKETIEDGFGGQLEWDSKEGRRACRIRKTYTQGGYQDEGDWEAVYEELGEGMAKLERALRPHIKAF